MANTVTIIDKKRAAGGNRITYVFKILPTGTYLTSATMGVAGETIAFNNALNPKLIVRPKLPTNAAGVLPPNSAIRVTRTPDGYDALVEQNATAPVPNNYVLRLFSSGDTALGSGAYAAAFVADTTGIIVEIDVPQKYA